MAEALWPANPAKVGDEWGVQLEKAPPDAEPGMVVGCSVTSKAGKKWTRDYKLVEETKWGWTALAVDKSDPSQPTVPASDPPEASMDSLVEVLASIEQHLRRIADALTPSDGGAGDFGRG